LEVVVACVSLFSVSNAVGSSEGRSLPKISLMAAAEIGWTVSSQTLPDLQVRCEVRWGLKKKINRRVMRKIR
jgi:hypothetical protein